MPFSFHRSDATWNPIAYSDLPATPGLFSVYRAVNQTGLTAATTNKILFGSKLIDSSSWYSVANHQFLPLLPGTWLVTVCVGVPLLSGDACQAAIALNGSIQFFGTYNPTTTGGGTQSVCTGMVTCNGSTDFIEGWAYTPSTTLTGGQSATYMHGFKVA